MFNYKTERSLFSCLPLSDHLPLSRTLSERVSLFGLLSRYFVVGKGWQGGLEY